MNAGRTEAPSEIRDAFLSDHRRLDALFAQLVAAFEANDREDIADLWVEFEVGLTEHMEAEERSMIPALARVNSADAKDILEDHARIRGRLAELGPGIDLHIVRLDVARAFIDELKAHAKREDRALYEWADEHLAEAERKSLLASLASTARKAIGARKRRDG